MWRIIKKGGGGGMVLKRRIIIVLGRLFDRTTEYACVLGARESSHNETVLSSTHNICSGED